MLYQYLALGVHVIGIIAALVALKYTAKDLKKKHEITAKANKQSPTISQAEMQPTKCQIFTYMMKNYSLLNIIAGIKSESMLLLLLIFALYSMMAYCTPVWYICFLEGITIQTVALILEYLHRGKMRAKNVEEKKTNSVQIRIFLQKSFFYYSVGVLAIIGHIFMALIYYQSQQVQNVRAALIYLGISMAIDNFVVKPVLFLILSIIPQFSILLSEIIPKETIKQNQVANVFIPTNESQAKIADEFTINIESIFQPGTNLVSSQNFESTNLQFKLSKNTCQEKQSASIGKDEKSRKKLYLESETKETTDKENTHKHSTDISHLSFERAMRQTEENKPQIKVSSPFESSINCNSIIQKIDVRKPAKRQLRKRRKEEQSSKFRETNERIISLYSEEKDRKQTYETLSIKRKSFDRSSNMQWSYSNRHKSTRSRDNPIVHEQPSYVTPKVVHFKLSDQL